MKLLNKQVPSGLGATRVTAVILDWAGTTVDFGSLAPVRTLERVFKDAGVPISEAEARRDMGIAKRDHIAALLGIDRIRDAWINKHGSEQTKTDGDKLYQKFIPLQFACLVEYSKVIDGVPDFVEGLRSSGIKIGSTTGYTRAMLDVLVTEAGKAGYRPDCSFSPEDAGAGRPYPFMIYAAAVKMQVYPLSSMLKIGDTPSDIKEGLNAGVWSVGVAGTGNGVGLAQTDFEKLSAAEQAEKVASARNELAAAGAHYVVNSLPEISDVIRDVEARLSGKISN